MGFDPPQMFDRARRYLREHPTLTQLTAIGVLGYVIKGLVENLFFDWVRAVLDWAFGGWLVVTDVIAIALFISKFVIPTALAAALVYLVYLLGRRDGAGMTPSVTGITQVATVTVRDKVVGGGDTLVATGTVRDVPNAPPALEPQPNWTFRELFLFIRPDILEGTPTDTVWEEVGQEVCDAMALGRLKCWGRPMKGRFTDLAKEVTKPPPEPIKPSYWRDAELSYLFLDIDGRYQPHTHPNCGSGVTAYCDLQVNREQAQSLAWKQKALVPLLEAATRSYEETRGLPAAHMAEGEKGVGGTLTWYCWALIDQVHMTGRRPPSRAQETIPKEARNTHSFSYRNGVLLLEERGGGHNRYEDIFVSEQSLDAAIEAMKTWGVDQEDSRESERR